MNSTEQTYKLLYRDVEVNTRFFYIIANDTFSNNCNYFFIRVGPNNALTHSIGGRSKINTKSIGFSTYKEVKVTIPESVLNTLTKNYTGIYTGSRLSDVVIVTFLLNYKDYERI